MQKKSGENRGPGDQPKDRRSERLLSALRVVRALGIAIMVIFLPVIFALILNGFNFSGINLGGSSVWFCLAVPLTPVFLVKYGRMDIYDNLGILFLFCTMVYLTAFGFGE